MADLTIFFWQQITREPETQRPAGNGGSHSMEEGRAAVKGSGGGLYEVPLRSFQRVVAPLGSPNATTLRTPKHRFSGGTDHQNSHVQLPLKRAPPKRRVLKGPEVG